MQQVLKREQKIERDKEHYWVLAMSSGNKILNLELVALGASNRLVTKPADVLSVPLQKQAAGVILVHNHPSGILEASEADEDHTNWMIQACRIMKTPVLDHVIITENSYLSFKDTGLLEVLENSLKYVPPYEIEALIFKEMQEEAKRIEQKNNKKLEEIEQKNKKEVEESLDKGRREGMHARTLDIAKNMLYNLKLGTEVIQQATGLSKEDIRSIKKGKD